jgi:hypothetical protein
MLLSAVSVLVVAQSSSEIPEGLMNNPVVIQVLVINIYNYRAAFVCAVTNTLSAKSYKAPNSQNTILG